MKSNVYLPIYVRPPNKLIKYNLKEFLCGNSKGIRRIAVFEDKHGNIHEETAQVIWEEDNKEKYKKILDEIQE